MEVCCAAQAYDDLNPKRSIASEAGRGAGRGAEGARRARQLGARGCRRRAMAPSLASLCRWPRSEPCTVAGLMTGTSCDALDVAVLRFAPAAAGGAWTLVAHGSAPLSDGSSGSELGARLATAGECSAHDAFALSFEYSAFVAEAVRGFLSKEGLLEAEVVDLVVSHGQTIGHAPAKACGWTAQIGDGNALAARLGLPVLWNLRSADVALGGQGAPLVPAADALLFARPLDGVVLLNVGGVANVTVLPPAERGTPPEAEDAGPGNCLLDHWCHQAAGVDFDEGGLMGLAGSVDEERAKALAKACQPSVQGESLDYRPPRREALIAAHVAGLSAADGCATLARVTAALAADAVRRACERAKLVGSDAPRELLVAGGGAHNAALLQRLQEEMGELCTVRALGRGNSDIPPDAREAACFAALGWLWLHGESGAVQGVTGASREAMLGSLALP